MLCAIKKHQNVRSQKSERQVRVDIMCPLIAKPSLERPLEFFVKIERKIPLKNGGFWAENLECAFFLCNFALSKRR